MCQARARTGVNISADVLVGSRDIADRLGFPHAQRIHFYLRSDPTFPKPVAQIGAPRIRTMLWSWPEVEEWAERTGRLPSDGRVWPHGRTVEIEDLVGSADIAARLGVRYSEQIHAFLRQRSGFPAPVAQIGGPTNKTLVWDWTEVEVWARKVGRLPSADGDGHGDGEPGE